MTPPKVNMGRVHRVLIIKLSAFGDIIHALPVAAALKATYPHIEITWAVEEAYTPLLAANPSIDHILALPKIRSRELRSVAFHRDFFRRLSDVRSRSFDLTLDLQGLFKSALVAAASGAKLRLAYHWVREAAALVERAIPREPGSVHIVDQYLDVARFVGANTSRPEFQFAISEDEDRAALALLERSEIGPCEKFVTINPASALTIKQWGSEKYAQLIAGLYDRTGIRCVVLTADRRVADEVQRFATVPFANLSGQTSLKELAAVIKRGNVHVCGDTGSGHLAAALGRPVVALIGPTDADRICPYGQRDNVVRHAEQCGPSCNWHHCQFPKPRCMEAISVQEVVEKVAGLI